jgi:hypothetical protein
MRNLLQRIVDAIRREPEAFSRIDRGARLTDEPRGRQDHLLDEGRIPRR